MRLALLFSLLSISFAWLQPFRNEEKGIFHREMSASGDNNKIKLDSSNPCWEDMYDDDCVMSNAASASFVAADWIKRMPCGEGIEVCTRLGGIL